MACRRSSKVGLYLDSGTPPSTSRQLRRRRGPLHGALDLAEEHVWPSSRRSNPKRSSRVARIFGSRSTSGSRRWISTSTPHTSRAARARPPAPAGDRSPRSRAKSAEPAPGRTDSSSGMSPAPAIVRWTTFRVPSVRARGRSPCRYRPAPREVLVVGDRDEPVERLHPERRVPPRLIEGVAVGSASGRQRVDDAATPSGRDRSCVIWVAFTLPGLPTPTR